MELKLGDMFDGPSDLIVLPCSTSGTITSFVRERLIHYRIPYPTSGMKLGDVVILPFDGGENIAQFIGFAASVASNSTNATAIERIGTQLGNVTQEQSTIRRVAAPLLGAGAGGLRSEVVANALAKGFKKNAHNDAQLVLHVLQRDVFERISSFFTEATETKEVPATLKGEEFKNSAPPPRVFVSYCHTSPDHEKWVESLGAFLRENGIDARLDIWHLRRGMDLPQFMANELTLAEKVVIVSDERYAEKADGRVGGVGWETMLIQGDVARLPTNSTKYFVVVRSQKIDAGLPQYLKTKFVIHWPNNIENIDNRKLLLRELYDVIQIPELGKRPLYL
ncbi:MAG: toll/interleukin-1 receptor domain-containing protein [Granulicella sp.]